MPETPARKRAEIVRSFTDAGTGESFTAGETPMVDAARFANYEHAGLVRHAPATNAPAERRKSAAKAARPRTKRAKAPAAVPAAPAPAEPAAASDAGGGASA